MYNFASSLTGLAFVFHNCSAPLSSLLLQADPSWKSVRSISLSYLKVCKQSHAKFLNMLLTWDQALFSFRFENYIPAGKAKQPLERMYENC